MSTSLQTNLVYMLCIVMVVWLSTHVVSATNTTIGSNSTSSNSTVYATKAELELVSYYLSVLQVVVIVNSAIVGLLLLVVGALTSIKCYEDYDPNSGVRIEDPLWLKIFEIFNWFCALFMCQCFSFARRKGKKIQVINTESWRRWHMKDLELQKEILDEKELAEDEENLQPTDK